MTPPRPPQSNPLDEIPYGVVNDYHQDTRPGSGHLLAPPDGFGGDEDDYFELIRERFFRHAGARTRILDVANAYVRPTPRTPTVVLEGPYRAAAAETLRRLVVWARETPGG